MAQGGSKYNAILLTVPRVLGLKMHTNIPSFVISLKETLIAHMSIEYKLTDSLVCCLSLKQWTPVAQLCSSNRSFQTPQNLVLLSEKWVLKQT